MIPHPAYAAPGGGDTVQSLYDALLSTMKNGRTLRQSGRFTQLEPVIRRTFDIIRPPSTQVLHKNIHRSGGNRLHSFRDGDLMGETAKRPLWGVGDATVLFSSLKMAASEQRLVRGVSDHAQLRALPTRPGRRQEPSLGSAARRQLGSG